MTTVYADTSALARIYLLDEPDSDPLRALLLDDGSTVATSEVSMAELARAVIAERCRIYGSRIRWYGMKTTLNIDDDLLRRAKVEAASRGVTLTRIVEEGLRAALTPPPRREAYELRWVPVRGHRAPDIDIADRDALYDRMERRP